MMSQLIKLNILKILEKRYHQYSFEEQKEMIPETDLVIPMIAIETWKSSDSYQKQEIRKSYLAKEIKRGGQINIMYYENMIRLYDLILEIIKKLERVIDIGDLENVDTGLLRISALVLAEKDFMDESFLPERHLRVDLISNLSQEYYKVYPDLNLPELTKIYVIMYRHWPGKPNKLDQELIEMTEKMTIFKVLQDRLGAGRGSISLEESMVIVRKSSVELWRYLDPFKKQDNRKRYLFRGKVDSQTAINLEYYEKMVTTYDLMIDLLVKLNDLLPNGEAIKKAETGLLRIVALILIAMDYIDESILPKHHLHAGLINAIAWELHETYPDLNLPQLAQSYSEMYELWPGKPDLSLKQPAKTEPEK